MRQALLARGATAEALDRIRCPAGLKIGAHTPEEIALAILAEIVDRLLPAHNLESLERLLPLLTA